MHFVNFPVDAYTIVCSIQYSAPEPRRPLLSLVPDIAASKTGISIVREAPPGYAGGIREEILDVFRAFRVAEAEIGLALGETLAWLRTDDRFQDSGLRTFDPFCKERLGIAGSTAYERIRVLDTLKRHPAMESAYRSAGLSDRHVLDLGKVLEGAEAGQERIWIGLALECTTRELRERIRDARPEADLEEERERLTFEVNPGLHELLHAAKNACEKVQGRTLSGEEFFRAMADEASSIPDPDLARPPEKDEAPDPRQEEEKKAPAGPPLPLRLLSREEIAQVRSSLLLAREAIDRLHVRAGRRPTSYLTAVAIARDLIAAERKLQIHRGTIIRLFRRCSSPWFHGLEEFHEAVGDALGVSKRWAQVLAEEAALFEENRAVRAAYEQGRVTIQQAHMIAMLGRIDPEPFLRDAETMSRTGFEQMIRIMLRVRSIDPIGFARLRGRMEYPRLMPRLIRMARKRFGIPRDEIRKAFRKAHVDKLAPLDLRKRSTDARVVGLLARRLECLLDLMGARIWNGEVPRRIATKMSIRTRRSSRTLKSSTKEDVLDLVRRIRRWAELEGETCSRSEGLGLLCKYVLRQWGQTDPERRVDPVFVRDDFRCMAPGCNARGFLHDHHAEYLSRGGTNDLWNRVSLCAWHHGLLHEGKMTLVGRADGILYWKIGISEPYVYMGNVRLRFQGETGENSRPSMSIAEAPARRILE